ncbi:MAG: tRNA pseudouridine(38-40) synthase TruA [Candidatus Improbicoccus pseudotrichonymphae]|uniref:tRNA pseudouridine synthase A n=1 Tax=Candidatus Improbicoccus pseudotrichonymphae TaxID=3033792 RepID=A0AA48IGM5_9FIRM|nr:MAG: tRNA pseudouridine(38-40) synthase TruA [Candidatus Improbicoccus pseudotrichonymphae]
MRNQEILGNVLMVISFDGGNYHGWQIQKNAVSIQEIFQECLAKVIGKAIDIKGCSRTDVGVHANVYCISADVPIKISEDNLIFALNNLLPNDIVVIKCLKTGENFHARYSCLAKEYVYKLYFSRIKDPFLNRKVFYYPRCLNIKLMKNAAKFFVGKHNFSSFYNKNNQKMDLDFTKNIFYFDIEKHEKIIEFRIKADGFLYNMIRIMIGTLIKISKDNLTPETVKFIMNKKDRKYAGPTVPACGLYINKIFYCSLDFNN